MVIRVFPVAAITAPRLPLEKSYTFFIGSALLWVGPSNRNNPCVVAAMRVDDDHQRAKHVHADCDKTLLTLRRVILDGNRKRVVEHTVALGKRDTMVQERHYGSLDLRHPSSGRTRLA